MAMKGLNYPTNDELGYSTDEVETGLTWIDGSTIYKKTVNLGTLPNTNTKDVSHGISNFGTLVKLEGIAWNNNSNYGFFLPYANFTPEYNIRLIAGTTYISVQTWNDRTNYSGYATVYYTKAEEE